MEERGREEGRGRENDMERVGRRNGGMEGKRGSGTGMGERRGRVFT